MPSLTSDGAGSSMPGRGNEEHDALLNTGSRSHTTDDPSPSSVEQGHQADGGICESKVEKRQQRQLYTLLLGLFVPLTVGITLLCLFNNPPNASSPPRQPPSTGPPGSKTPHVPVPIGGGNWTLPPPSNVPRNDAYWTQGRHGVVASEEAGCSRMGVDILKRGGNAVVSAMIMCIYAKTLC